MAGSMKGNRLTIAGALFFYALTLSMGQPVRLAPCSSSGSLHVQNRREPSFMFVNVMEGGRERVPLLEHFVAKRNNTLKVIGFSELNGWQAKDLATFGRQFGFPYSVFVHAATGYHLGAISKAPITVLHSSSAPPMHHGVIIFRVGGGTVVALTHLSPRSSQARAAEATYITQELNTCCQRLPVLVMGDLNTLSACDQPMPSATIDILSSTTLLRRKFLTPAGDPDLRPMQLLLDGAHLLDLGASQDNTVPTTMNSDYMHAAPMRLDYFLANEIFIKTVVDANHYIESSVNEAGDLDHSPLQADRDTLPLTLVHRSSLTARMSDHYPITV